MPAKTARRSVASKLNKAIKNTRNNETRTSQMGLPGGIRNGVAIVSEAEMGTAKESEKNPGELYIQIVAIVDSPEKAPCGTKVKGKYTRKRFPLCETKNKQGKVTSFDDNVDEALNTLRKLGLDTSELEDENDLRALVEELAEEPPAFEFYTAESEARGQYAARVWENWGEAIQDYDQEENNSEEPEEETEEESEGQEGEEEEETEDEEETEEEEDEYEQEEPEKGENYFYKPPRAKKARECEVVGVLTKSKKVHLKDAENGKTYKSVPYDKLQLEE